jgi:hypothetical protein
MTSKETKRQHYVPRTYLKHFSEERSDNYFIKAIPTADLKAEKINEFNILNVCLQKDLYTLPSDTAEGRMLIEQFYNENIETHYDRIYQLLIDPNKRTLTDEERRLIISTVVTMYYRTSKWLNAINGFFNSLYEDAYNRCKQTGKNYFMFEKAKISIANKTLEQLQKESRVETRPDMVLTQLQVALNLINLRSVRDGIYVSKLMDDDCEFITSDNPVCCVNLNTPHVMPADPSNVLILPLDHKHKLYLMPYADNSTKNLLMRHNHKGVMCYSEKLTANHQQVKNGERFILGRESALLTSLIDKQKHDRQPTEEELEKFKQIDEMYKKLVDSGIIK